MRAQAQLQQTNVITLPNKPVYKPILESALNELQDVKRELKKWEEKETKLKKLIYEMFGDNTEAYNAVGHVIATFTTEANNSWDKKRFEIDYPGIYNNYVIYNTKKVLRLK
jgi:hypothetical protein